MSGSRKEQGGSERTLRTLKVIVKGGLSSRGETVIYRLLGGSSWEFSFFSMTLSLLKTKTMYLLII